VGSFQEGFFDPLTAKLRKIPLEIVRVEQGKALLPGKGAPMLSYAEDESNGPVSRWDFSDTPASIPNENNRALLSFDIPGLVALNHPDKNLNGGSSEFFSLQLESLPDSKRSLLDGEYAPFGYITEGYDIFLSLLPGDVIESTYVDEFGALNLVKLRQSSFSQVVQSSEQDFRNQPAMPPTSTKEEASD
jgi:cyclophilin family peptidyl-prolyl cis-trans isomerase